MLLSESTEMYLITIYRLTDETPSTSISDIAQMLKVHHSSASEKIKHLTEEGFVVHKPHGAVNLTDSGRTIALSVLRKHRLMKTFLVQMADYGLDEVYDEACRLEHAISERLADALERMLNYPKVDPHGYPIPSRDGQVAELHFDTLDRFQPGDRLVVRRVNALDHAKLSYLQRLGLVPGATLHIERIEPFDGPMILALADATVAIAPTLAAEIEVTPA